MVHDGALSRSSEACGGNAQGRLDLDRQELAQDPPGSRHAPPEGGIAMLEGLIAKLALGALWSRVKTNAAHDWQAIPPKARLWIIGIVAAILAIVAHQWWAHHVLNEAREAAYTVGYAKAVTDIQTQEAKVTAVLEGVKTKGDAKNVAINEGVKKSHDAQT